MFNVICVTDMNLCDDFFNRIEELYKNGVPVILRAKELSEAEYERMAEKALRHCLNLTAHFHIEAAKRLGIKKIHIPMHKLSGELRKDFELIGVSVHSPSEAAEAEKGGASYVTAGHIFATDCKKGILPRGTDFLKDTVNSVTVPVYGIGGISPENILNIRDTGAAGACIMSGFMRCGNVEKYLEEIRKNLLKN